jgi:hypothetical protein
MTVDQVQEDRNKIQQNNKDILTLKEAVRGKEVGAERRRTMYSYPT